MVSRPSQRWNMQGLPWSSSLCWEEMLVRQDHHMWFMLLPSEVHNGPHRGEAPLTHLEMPSLS